MLSFVFFFFLFFSLPIHFSVHSIVDAYYSIQSGFIKITNVLFVMEWRDISQILYRMIC